MVERDLDELLVRRMAPPAARSNLAERIITSALEQKPKQKAIDAGKWIAEFFDSFALPQPALALGVTLVLGLYLGVNIEANAQEPVAENLAAYLDMNNGESQ